MNIQPVIKWTGSKRTQSEYIVKLIPNDIDTYYEPFLGGGSMLIRMLEECEKGNKNVKHFVASDLNADLIGIFKIIKETPDQLINDYSFRSTILRELDWDKATEYYNSIRRTYNSLKPDDILRPYLLFFLTRTCFNGLIRYNSNGEFNTSFHINRYGIEPYKMAKIICKWSNLLNKYDVKFASTSYEYILPLAEENDFIYLDPPYANSSSKMYQHDIFDNLKMFDMLRECPCKYALSYDGRVEDEDNTFNVPTNIYKRHEYINARNSAFRRIVTQKTKEVNESLYMNYEKP